MKKFICFSIAFISLASFAFGQWRHEKINPWLEKSRENQFKSMQMDYPCAIDLPSPCKSVNLNNHKSLEWRLDTIVAYDTLGVRKRLSTTLDVHGNILILLKEQMQSTLWENAEKHTCSYDGNGNLMTYLYEQWQADAWMNYYRITYTYDANGNMLTNTGELWQENAWANASKYTYTYDANGNKLTSTTAFWESGSWVNHVRDTYAYSTSGNMLTILSESWQSNTWGNRVRYTYSYDANGNILTWFREDWHTNTWVNTSRFTYSYDVSEKLLGVNEEVWSASQWMNHSRVSYTYDVSGNMVISMEESWLSNAWMKYLRYTYTYDANGNSVTGKNEIWNNSIWNPTTKGYFWFDFLETGQYQLSGVYRYEATFTAFVNAISRPTAGINTISVFPNPSNEQITIKLPKPVNTTSSIAIIYGMDGLQMIRQQVQGFRIEINVSSLPTGVYFIRLGDGKETMVGKFVKN